MEKTKKQFPLEAPGPSISPNFFLGFIVGIVLILVLLLIFSILRNVASTSSIAPTPTITATASVSPTATVQPTSIFELTPDWKWFQSGVSTPDTTETYFISYPHDWKFSSNDPAVITLSKNGYQINIVNTGHDGGGECYFNDTPGAIAQYDLDFHNSTYREVVARNLTFRFVAAAKPDANGNLQYTTCYHDPSSMPDKVFGGNTLSFFLSYQTPAKPTAAMLAEMDSIIKTILIDHP